MRGVSAAEVDSLCSADMHVYFACMVTAEKMVSLCGSDVSKSETGVLTYRYGRPDAVELEFSSPLDTESAFRIAGYHRFKVNRTSVSFDRNGYGYSLFDNEEGDIEPPERERGVTVSAPGDAEPVTLACVGENSISELPALEQRLPCDDDDPMTMEQCGPKDSE